MKTDLLAEMRNGTPLSLKKQIHLIIQLSIPAILAQLSYIMMSYIDTSMVGQLATEDSAAIGLVSSSTWLIGGLSFAAAMGFTVQLSQLIGSGKEKEARNLLKISMIFVLAFSLIIALATSIISPYLPHWLGSDETVSKKAFVYFFIFAISFPIIQLNDLAAGMLQAAGEMKIPAIMQVVMAILNVILNYVLIFRMELGVTGAALGTLIARFVTATLLILHLLFKSKSLRLRKNERLSYSPEYLRKAVKIGLPVAFEQLVMSSGQVAFTKIVAPLGNVALSANSFAITAESVCYMPAHGLGAAASTLTGQSFGARRFDLTKRLSWLTTLLGIILMIVTGVMLFVFSHEMISFLSPNPAIQELGSKILKIEAFSEPFYGASLVASGALRGIGDTFIPSLYKFGAMWFVRIPLAIILASPFGLEGIWFAMSFELFVRGSLFLLRLWQVGKKLGR